MNNTTSITENALRCVPHDVSVMNGADIGGHRYIGMVVADVLAPNRCQDISSYHPTSANDARYPNTE